MLRFCPLFSSSSGNSVYIGENGHGILVDVGRSAKQITAMLNSIEAAPETIEAILITHEHSDHVQGLRVFAARYNIPVYSSNGTLFSLRNKEILNDKHIDMTIPDSGMEICGMFVKPFKTSHDCSDGRGYVITSSDGVSRAAIATDTGYVSSELLSAITGCGLVFIESNHDIAMLKTGPYPIQLQQRILSNVGHLSNDACSDALRALVNKGTTRFVLAHLSRDNNTPHTAYDTAVSSLLEIGAMEGRDYLLDVAAPENSQRPFIV